VNRYEACDEDWLRFETSTFGSVIIKTWASGAWAQPDTELELFDTNLNLISATNFSVGQFAWIGNINLPVGEYFIRVTNNSLLPTPESRGHYNIQVKPGVPVNAESGQNLSSLLTIAPNPNSGKFSITFSGIKKAQLDFRLIDIQGRSQFEESHRFFGRKAFEIDVKHLPSGIYFLKVNGEGQSFTRKIIIRN
jgi:hypothetical protein